jgi:hypothetical protein
MPRLSYPFSIIDPNNNHTTSTEDRTYLIIFSKNCLYPIDLHAPAFLQVISIRWGGHSNLSCTSHERRLHLHLTNWCASKALAVRTVRPEFVGATSLMKRMDLNFVFLSRNIDQERKPNP